MSPSPHHREDHPSPLKPNDLEGLSALHSYSKIAVALSGGADSTALLKAASRTRELGSTLAFHIDHGCRSSQSRQEERQFVDELCRQHHVELHRHTLPDQAQNTGEAHLRDQRYQALARMASQLNVDAVALGHHREDQIETFFLNLLRGTDIAGLTGIPEQIVREGTRFIRPLLDVPKADILRYLETQQQAYFQDPSNASEHYRRNAYRHQLIPLLQELSPHFEERLLQTTKSIGEWDHWGNDELQKFKNEHHWSNIDEHTWSFPRAALLQLPSPLLRRWCHQTLSHFAQGSQNITRKHCSSLADFITSPNTGHHPWPFPADTRVRARKREILFCNQKVKSPPNISREL